MWNCDECGCQSIAHDLDRCPQCRTARSAPAVAESVAASSGKPPEEPEQNDNPPAQTGSKPSSSRGKSSGGSVPTG